MKNFLKNFTAKHTYSCGLPPRMGWLRYRLLKLIFCRIQTDAEQYKVISDLPPDAIVIYVNKNKSKFECLLYYIQCTRHGLPTPRIAFDYRFFVWQPLGRLLQIVRNIFISAKKRHALPDAYASGYIRTGLLQFKAGFLSLIGKSGFSDHWAGIATDPLEYLIGLQRQITQPIYLIPHLILSKDTFQFEASHLHSEYAYLQELFSNEFFFDPDQTTAYQVRKAIKAFIDGAILVPHPTLPDTYNLTSPGYRKLQFFSSLLKPLFESYLVALSCYREMSEKLPSRKARVKAMRSLALSMRKRNQIDRIEAISEVYFNQADAIFSQFGFQKKETSERSEELLRHIRAYLMYLS
jgi:hypothetical protein